MMAKRYDGEKWVPIKGRAGAFLDLFTEEEKASWAGRQSKTPDWIVDAVSWFIVNDRKELMDRLKD